MSKFSEEQKVAILREGRARAQNVSPVQQCFAEYEARAAQRAALAKVASECEAALRDADGGN
jgi:hypothetical protein